MSVITVNVGKLKRRADARAIDKNVVAALAASMRELGVINPLRVRPTRIFFGGDDVDGYEVIAGAHRLEASRDACINDLPCIVVADDDVTAELAMIDENLCRAELSPADRARQTARRKALYEDLHPETRHGAFNQHTAASRKVCDLQPNRFTSDTASATGQSERSVQLDAKRGKAIGDDLRLIQGTSLDKGRELDALAKMPPPQRRELIDRAQRGEQVSAIRPAAAAAPAVEQDQQPDNERDIDRAVAAFMAVWNALDPSLRPEVLVRIGRAVRATPAALTL